jgi:hypothetical protein
MTEIAKNAFKRAKKSGEVLQLEAPSCLESARQLLSVTPSWQVTRAEGGRQLINQGQQQSFG